MAMRSDSFQFLCDDILPSLRHTEEILSLIGIYFIGKSSLKIIYKILFGFKTHVASLILPKDLNKFGNWAVAIECTDNLSALYVEEFAKRGFNVALLSSDEQKDSQMVEYMASRYKVKCEPIPIDNLDCNNWNREISNHLRDKEVGVLINSVDILPDPTLHLYNEPDFCVKKLNISSLPFLMDAMLPLLLKSDKAVVINTFSCFNPEFRQNIHFEFHTKAFLESYSTYLRRNFSDQGLTVQSLDFTYMRANDLLLSFLGSFRFWFIPTQEQFVSRAFNTLGHSSSTPGYWLFSLQSWFLETFFPVSLSFLLLKPFAAILRVKQKIR